MLHEIVAFIVHSYSVKVLISAVENASVLRTYTVRYVIDLD